MSPRDRCDRIVDLIDRVLAETAIAARPVPVPVPVRVREQTVRGR